MNLSVATPYLAAAGLPLFLLLLSALFRRFYRTAIGKRIYNAADLNIPSGFGSKTFPLRFHWFDPRAPTGLLEVPEFVDALKKERAVRRALVVSAAVHTLLSAVIVWWGLLTHDMGFQGAIAVASINTASAVGLVLIFLRFRVLSAVAVVLAWIALQIGVLMVGISEVFSFRFLRSFCWPNGRFDR
jgi:hypothetical protein